MHHTSSTKEWNDATIARLRALWVEGHSTAEIGRRMNFSKNAIVGKAHRLNLPARPSPIVRTQGYRARPKVSRKPPQLPRTAALPVLAARRPEVAAAPPRLERPPVEPQRPVVGHSIRRIWTGSTLQADRDASCCWPLGEPGSPDFRQCDDPTIRGKPYCDEHCRIAYVKIRDRRESDARSAEYA